MSADRLRLEEEFAQAVARCASALNEQLLAAMRTDTEGFSQSERAIIVATKERQGAKTALIEHLKNHGC